MLLYEKGLRLQIEGESHGPSVGMRLNGIPAGISIDLDELQAFVDRRKSRKAAYSTTRGEEDKVLIRKGIENGRTTGGEIVAEIMNLTQRSSDYSDLKFKPRPSHADYPAYIKYGLDADLSGGGKFSGRLTAPLCIAGGIAIQILKRYGIDVIAYISEIVGIKGASYRDKEVTEQDIMRMKSSLFPLLDESAYENMMLKIESARESLDSVGGVIEAVAMNVPAGTGGALFDGIESRAAALLFGIPAVKGLEFGSGFGIASLNGSAANDFYRYKDGKVVTETNHNGGILGGMSTGMPIALRVAIKPTPSIGKPQKTVNLMTGENTEITVRGRHDSCIVPRAVPAVEAALALAILDCIYEEKE